MYYACYASYFTNFLIFFQTTNILFLVPKFPAQNGLVLQRNVRVPKIFKNMLCVIFQIYSISIAWLYEPSFMYDNNKVKYNSYSFDVFIACLGLQSQDDQYRLFSQLLNFNCTQEMFIVQQSLMVLTLRTLTSADITASNSTSLD